MLWNHFTFLFFFQMLLAQSFQEMCLKIILDRSEFMCGHVPLKKNNVCESSSSIFYLLLPVIPQKYGGSISVDWMVIRRCLSSPIFAPLDHLVDTCISLDSYLHLADGPVSVNDILNSLVYVAHKKSFFFVSQIIPDKSGYSFHNSSTSHIEHLSEKYVLKKLFCFLFSNLRCWKKCYFLRAPNIAPFGLLYYSHYDHLI